MMRDHGRTNRWRLRWISRFATVLVLVLAAAGLHALPAAAMTGPTFTLFYGPSQDAGATGTTQTWVNVMGRVTDTDGVVSLSSSLNGGTPELLGMGPKPPASRVHGRLQRRDSVLWAQRRSQHGHPDRHRFAGQRDS